jgi:hypothetical protein
MILLIMLMYCFLYNCYVDLRRSRSASVRIADAGRMDPQFGGQPQRKV